MTAREDAAPDEEATVSYVRAVEGELRGMRERADEYAAKRRPMLSATLAELANERTINAELARAISDGWMQGYLERALGREISIDAIKAALELIAARDEGRLGGDS